MKKKYSTAEVIEFVIFLALLVIAFARLFYRLGAAGLNATDEAWYAVDTCEMLKSGNWIVPTHQYHIDIGSKPPFGLWLIMLTYKVFGYSAFSLRFYSAVSGFLTILGIAGYLYKRFGAKYAVFATAVFSTLDTCFNYHMFRAGDMDALFSLIFVVTLYSLIRLSEGEEKMMILYGVCISLGFGVKSLHVALLIFILALYFPFVYKHIRAKYVAIAALITVIPNVIWMVLRYQVDGWAFLYKVTLGELDDKTSDFLTLGFVRSMAQEKVTWIMLAVLFIRVVIYFVENGKKLSWNKFRTDFLSMCKKRYISIIAYFAPIVMYSLAGDCLEWYTFPSYVASIWIIAIAAGEIVEKIDKKAIGNAFACLLIAVCVFIACSGIYKYKYLGSGGRALDQFRDDITEFTEQTNNEYAGKRAYLANDRHRITGGRDHWELEFLFYGEAIADLTCVDGGVEGFLADEDSLMVIDGSLWDEYADVLTGYVFLEQNTFYVLSHERY